MAIFEKRQINLSGLDGIPLLQIIFNRYQLGCMTRPLGFYNPILVWEFYSSYHATVSSTIPRGDTYVEQP